ncbi:MAG: hypothetical protein R3B45_15485 [Bdellovibrionota bacterium]
MRVGSETGSEAKSQVALGVFSDQKKICCYFASKHRKISIAESFDGEKFALSDGYLPVKSCIKIHLSKLDIGQVAIIESSKGKLSLAFSKNLKEWKSLCHLERRKVSDATIVPQFQLDGKYLMLVGGKVLKLCWSRNAYYWNFNKLVELKIKVNENDETIELDCAELIECGILVCYRILRTGEKFHTHQIYLAILDKNDPEKVIWNSQSFIWESDPEWGRCQPVGAVLFHSGIYGFWNTFKFGLLQVRYPTKELPFTLPINRKIGLIKSQKNPIIYPRSQYQWEKFSTFNPAAFLADGRVHILYRAQSDDLMSSIGYASSSNGIDIDERFESPIYKPQEVFESYEGKDDTVKINSIYASGGGVAGCEDPRVTLIDDTVYMTYVAFDGSNPPRIALTSIYLDDFLAKRWRWKRPVLISPPNIVDKSGVIFPEKIDGKFVIMHRIFPNILIDFEEFLDFDGRRWLRGEYQIPILENSWDSRKIGAGAPPLKTEDGWLLIYYGVDDRDDRFYKIGAMLLDLEDPTKVLYRSSSPILEPEEWYENSGFKPGVAYPCGAVILESDLFVYYGGADSVVCVAQAKLKEFIQALKEESELNFTVAETRRVNYDAPYSYH